MRRTETFDAVLWKVETLAKVLSCAPTVEAAFETRDGACPGMLSGREVFAEPRVLCVPARLGAT